MTQVLATGDENAGQEMNLPVPGRASPLRVRAIDGSSLGALIPPLSTVIYADANTLVPTAEQTGSIAAPFALLSAAIAEVPDAFAGGRTIMLTPGDYGAPTPVVEKSITFLGLAQPGSLDQPTIQVEPDAASVYFQNVAVFFDAVNSPTIELLNCQAGGNAGGGSVYARFVAFTGTVDDAAVFRADECDVNILTDAGNVELNDCYVNGDITCSGTLTIRNLRGCVGGLTLTATSIVVDSETLRTLVFAGTTFVGTVSGYGGSELTWGAAAATTAQFLPPGARSNAASLANENLTTILIPSRCVVCRLTAFANTTTTLTVRRNAGNTALTASPNNAIVQNNAVFEVFDQDERISIGVTGAAGGDALCSVLVV